MALFEVLDARAIAEKIRGAAVRVLVCAPGFDDGVGSALVDAHRRLPKGNVAVIVDGGEHSARLGYGYFDAIKQLSDAGVPIRVEPGVRLGVLVVDDSGWVFASPPLLVDATMESSTVPNAMALLGDQVKAVLSALVPHRSQAADRLEAPAREPHTANPPPAPAPELGQKVASRDTIERTHAALEANPPQRFDLARKVTVFNAFVQFVELELLGTQLGRQRISIPPELLLAVSDRQTRERLTTSFRVIGDHSELGTKAQILRKKIEGIRKEFLRPIAGYGSIVLRARRPQLLEAISAFREELEEFSAEVRSRLEEEIERSRAQLVESILPGIEKSPPAELRSSVIGEPTRYQARQWIEGKLDKVLPLANRLAMRMELQLVFKDATYETLNDPNFQRQVRAAYPLVNFDKPFHEFTAAASACSEAR